MNIHDILSRKFIYCLVFIFTFYRCKQESALPEYKFKENEIVLKGSDSELNLMKFFAEEYKKIITNISFDVSGGGTVKGIKALIDGETEIANASRYITDEEIENARTRTVTPVPIIIASDVIAIITHPETGVDSISLIQLSKILKGTIHNWKELGGNDLAIKIYGRDNNSGTKHFLMRALNCEHFSELHMNLKSNKDIITEVCKEKGSIGYVNVGSIVDKDGKPNDKIWAMNLYADGILSCSPFEFERIKNSDYPLTRPLIQYISAYDDKVLNFIKFELEEKQQKNLSQHGFIPINENQKHINEKQNLFKEY